MIESILALIILLLLPSEQSGGLLAYSPYRWAMIAAVTAVLGSCISLFFLLRSQEFNASLEKRLPKIPANVWSVLAKLLLFLLLSLGFFYNRFLGGSDPANDALKQRILPVFLLAVLMAAQSLVLAIRLNRHLHSRNWFESVFVFPMTETLLRRVDSFSTRVLSSLSSRVSRPVLIGLVLLWPLAFNLVISGVFFGTTLADFTIETSDEVKYWLEAAAFKTAGFNGGQFGTDHEVARAEFVHFSSRGPFYAVLQGSIGKLIGWQSYTPVLTNLFFILAALVAYLRILKPDKNQLLLTWLVLALFTPLYIYIPSAMQQGLHQAFGIVIAALFIRWVQSDHNGGRRFAAWLVVLIFFAALFRYSWIMLYLPVFMIAIRKFDPRKRVLLLGAIAVFSAAALAAALYLWAPYPVDIRYQIIDALQRHPLEGLGLIWENISRNLRGLFDEEGVWIQIFRAQFSVLLISASGLLIAMIGKRKNEGPSTSNPLHLVHSLNILTIFLLNISFYYVRSSNDYRIWAPHLLLSLLLLLYAKPRRTLWVVLLLGLLVWFFPGKVLPNLDFANGADPAIAFQRTAAFSKEVEDYLEFIPGQNKWCNTIEISKYGQEDEYSRPTLLGLPQGFGFMTTLNWQNTQPEDIQAKYLLLDPGYLEEEAPGLFAQLDLTFLTATSLGDLYLNHGSACPD